MREYVISIPNWHPVRLNSLIGVHWAIANKRKKEDYKIIWYYAAIAVIPKATKKRRVEITIILGPKQRAGDPDSYFKVVCDALAKIGLLTDDNRQGVELAPISYKRSAKKATLIKLIDL